MHSGYNLNPLDFLIDRMGIIRESGIRRTTRICLARATGKDELLLIVIGNTVRITGLENRCDKSLF